MPSVPRKEKWLAPETEELARAFLQLRNSDEVKRFLRDLLTEGEIMEFGRRLKAARLLDRGVPYREIGRQTWLSPRTIARVKKWLTSGKGGYRMVIDRLSTHRN